MTKEQNSLLRSVYQIAQRKGKDTNWEALENNVKKELLIQSGIGGFEFKEVNEQFILQATCTPLTYRLPSEESLED